MKDDLPKINSFEDVFSGNNFCIQSSYALFCKDKCREIHDGDGKYTIIYYCAQRCKNYGLFSDKTKIRPIIMFETTDKKEFERVKHGAGVNINDLPIVESAQLEDKLTIQS